MKLKWVYDNSNGGEIDIDPVDFAGKTAKRIEEELYALCVRQAKAQAACYVPELDEAVAQIVAENAEVQ